MKRFQKDILIRPAADLCSGDILFVKNRAPERNILPALTAVAFFILVPSSLQANEFTQKPGQPHKKSRTVSGFKEASSSEKIIPIKQQSENKKQFNKELVNEISEIFELIHKNDYLLPDKLPAATKEKVIRQMLNALGGGVKYISSSEAEKKDLNADKQENKTIYPPLLLDDGKVLYLRINSFDTNSVLSISRECKKIFKSKIANQITGTIVDLRNSQGDDANTLQQAVAVFASSDQFASLKLRGALTHSISTPLVLLTGSGTTGSAEIFEYLLCSRLKRAMAIGEKTHGTPFKRNPFKLKNGAKLLIPEIPKRFRGIPQTPQIPDITCQAYPQIKFEKLQKNNSCYIHSDIALKRAMDIIVSLNSLQEQK